MIYFRMISIFLAFILCFVSSTAQEVVQISCGNLAMTIRVQKALVNNANFSMDDLHLNDGNCEFDQEDEDFYIRVISPLTSCGTHYNVNATHVQFINSVSTIETGPTFPHGVIVGSSSSGMILSTTVHCTYQIDLTVSTQFIPNITVIDIPIPDAFGQGRFRAAMAIYTDNTYQQPYRSPPIMEPDETIYVGINLIGNVSQDIYLLVEKCWGTTTNNSEAELRYPLIENGCSVPTSADGLVRVTQNGDSHQALWNSPVFKFVGRGDEFDNVWLHCDLQLCINDPCEPVCRDNRRKRRSLDDVESFGPEHFNIPYVISLGPITLVSVPQNLLKNISVDSSNENLRKISDGNSMNDNLSGVSNWNVTATVIVASLGLLSIICLSLVVFMTIRARNSSSKRGFDLGDAGGVVNKSFS